MTVNTLNLEEQNTLASYMPVFVLTLSAWMLTITAGIALYWIVPGYKDVFVRHNVQLPELSMLLFEASNLPLYIPVFVGLLATIAAVIGLAIGWFRQRLMIILAMIANIVVLVLLSAMYYSMHVPLQTIAHSGP